MTSDLIYAVNQQAFNAISMARKNGNEFTRVIIDNNGIIVLSNFGAVSSQVYKTLMG